ncbi:hypothetical protein EJ377_17335 [Chryseobacterium arthrosphaerae]|uniref:Uncharacterized protein n=1 Tax=Chryseobacterium arthrosphaerae TaxID=651561 RepID=A0A432DST5_9FLAO|nr:hypothetical protein EJ377_17335 [Chryseobacterium arthrosphaerae]
MITNNLPNWIDKAVNLLIETDMEPAQADHLPKKKKKRGYQPITKQLKKYETIAVTLFETGK